MSEFLLFLLAFLLILPFPLIPLLIHKAFTIPGVPFDISHQKNVMMMASLYAAVLALAIWRVDIAQIGAAFVWAYWHSYELVLVAFCAFIFQQPFRQSRACSVIREGFARISPDPRIQAILIAWFWGSGVESIMGMATTNGLSALMLCGLGFPPMGAIMLALMGTVPASAFCSVGTPILYGIKHGMEEPYFVTQLAAMGLDLNGYLRLVTAQTGIIHGIIGIFNPLFMVLTLTRFFGRHNSWKEGLEVAPFAIFSGLVFCVPFALSAIFIGPEFASLIGALVGAALIISALKIGIFVPKEKWELPPQAEWRHDWAPTKTKFKPEALAHISPWIAWSPFILLAVLLILTRMPVVADFLASITFSWPAIFGSPTTARSEPFFLPVTWILVAMIIFATLIFKLNGAQIRAFSMPALIPTASMLLKAPNSILMMAIFMTSAINHSGFPSMSRILAEATAWLPFSQIWYTFFTPWIAALASTLGTNNVFSNLFCAPVVFNMEQTLHLPPGFLMALQVAGAGAGNMIALRYITSTVTFMGMLAWEGPVGRRMLLPTLLYVTLLGIIGIIGVTCFNFSAFVWKYLF
ncbi:MAG: L-lactate permease [Verrucomicrobiota bacterium]